MLADHSHWARRLIYFKGVLIMACIIFDFDGVLIDSRKSWIHAFKETIKLFGKSYTDEEIASHFGPKTIVVLRELIGESEEEIQKAKEQIDKILKKDGTLALSRVDPEANEILKYLREQNHYVALVTNGDRAFIDACFEKGLFEKTTFDKIITADSPFENKAEAIDNMISNANCSPLETYYIGDKADDVEVAKKVGCKSIILSKYEWESEEKIKEKSPDYIIHNLRELKGIIK